MFISRKITTLLSALPFLLFQGCVDQSFHGGECAQGLEVSFYSRTRCQNEATYPEEVTDIRLFIFDRDEILVSQTEYYDVELSGYYTQSIDLAGGLYSAVAWSGLNEMLFDLSALQTGVSTKEEVLFTLLSQGGTAESLDGVRIYQGESPASYVAEGRAGTVYEKTSVNLLEITNRISVTVEGLPDNGSVYTMSIEADNGTMTLGGDIVTGGLWVYEPVYVPATDNFQGDFTILKLETGPTYTLVIKNSTTGAELFRGSLLGTLILKNPGINLNCDHDFEIRFTAEDQCDCGTYVITEIWVNNWLIHSYGTDL